MKLEAHPAANLFPPMSADEYAGLVKDIRENGQREPILLSHDGLIVDGRNRYRACLESGIEPRTLTVPEPVSLTGLVLSLNLHRRNLSETQRAMVAAKAKPMFEDEARLRMKAGGELKGKANMPEASKGQSRDHAAEALNVSARAVEHASKVLRSGTPELVAKVESGDIAVSTAAEVAEFPEPEQARLASLPPREIRAEIRKSKPLPSPAQARKEAIAAGVPVAANTGVYILPVSKREEDALGEFACQTREIYEAVRLLSECGWSPEKLACACEKWNCSADMPKRVIQAYDYLEKVMYHYARNGKTATGD